MPCAKSPARKSTAGVVVLRRQSGQKARSKSKKRFYDASAVKNPEPLAKYKTAKCVVTVRPERGYSATNYDGSPAQPQKALRRQTGHFYDVKKVRNIEAFGMISENSSPLWRGRSVT